MKRTICVITTSRADYGLLLPLLKEIDADPNLLLQLVVSGMHLSPEFGMTVNEIERDGFRISERIETVLSSDTAVGVAKAVGLGCISSAEYFQRQRPDMVVVLGDRFELFAVVTAAMIAQIPVAHIHGGELTEGAMDDAFRHAISKMSQLHFTATESYRKRVIQLGEEPARVLNVGALGVDTLNSLKLMGRDELVLELGFTFRDHNFLVTFHPVTREQNTAETQVHELLAALDSFPDAGLIFTLPNADQGGREIAKKLDEYVRQHQNRAVLKSSLGQLRYLSAMKISDLVLGNSSSGIIEAPSLKKATVNIGDRQMGRVRAESIIDCLPERETIRSAIEQALSDEFQKRLVSVQNPHGDGGAATRIVKALKLFPCQDGAKKRFYDL